jgi:polar amino acid transport system substrate-binding protein
VLQQHGWSGRIVPVLAFNRFQVYLACNPRVPAGQVERLNAVAGDMRRDGTMRRIEQAWAGWTPAPARPDQPPAAR